MKRKELIKRLEAKGWKLHRHGGNHDIYTDGVHRETIPRHADIDETLARAIVRKWGL